MTEHELFAAMFACIDNTSLNATDNEASIEAFCHRTLEMAYRGHRVGAVCLYPSMVATAKRLLAGIGIKVASVAGAFPHGQLPLELRRAEVSRVVDDGADEVDIVINRGLLLAGRFDEVRNEVAVMKEACAGRTLKVILETAELPSEDAIRKASMLALEGGADFIKTSTGKGSAGATPEAARVMLDTLSNFVKINKRRVGFKVAGGIRTPQQAKIYVDMAMAVMGADFIDNKTFRIGASSLTEAVFALLTN